MTTVEDLVFYGLVATFVYLVIRQVSSNWQAKLKHQAWQARNKNESLGIGAGIDSLLDNLPEIRKQLEEMRMAMKVKGAQDKQLEPIDQRIGMVNAAQQWEPVIRMFAPLLDRIGTKTLDRGFHFIERLVTG